MPSDELPDVTAPGWRRRTATGAVLTAVALGLRDTLEGRQEREPIVVHVDGDPGAPVGPVELHLEPHRPELTWVLVRPAPLAGP